MRYLNIEMETDVVELCVVLYYVWWYEWDEERRMIFFDDIIIACWYYAVLSHISLRTQRFIYLAWMNKSSNVMQRILPSSLTYHYIIVIIRKSTSFYSVCILYLHHITHQRHHHHRVKKMLLAYSSKPITVYYTFSLSLQRFWCVCNVYFLFCMMWSLSLNNSSKKSATITFLLGIWIYSVGFVMMITMIFLVCVSFVA